MVLCQNRWKNLWIRSFSIYRKGITLNISHPLPGNWRRDFLFVEKAVAESKKLWYNLDVVLPTPGNGRRCWDGSYHYFLVAVAAGVACHYIIKWLDGDHKDNK